MARIVTNVFLDEVRRRRRRPTVALPEQPDLVLPPSAAADEAHEALSDEIQQRARRAAGGVPRRGRAVRRRRPLVRRDRRRRRHPGRHRALADPPRPAPAPDGAVVTPRVRFRSARGPDLRLSRRGVHARAERAAVDSAARLRPGVAGRMLDGGQSPPAMPVRGCRRSNRRPGFIDVLIDAACPRHAPAAVATRHFAGLAAVAGDSLPASCWPSPKHDDTAGGAAESRRSADSHGATALAAVGPGQRLGADRGDARVDGAASREAQVAAGRWQRSVSSSWRSRWPRGGRSRRRRLRVVRRHRRSPSSDGVPGLRRRGRGRVARSERGAPHADGSAPTRRDGPGREHGPDRRERLIVGDARRAGLDDVDRARKDGGAVPDLTVGSTESCAAPARRRGQATTRYEAKRDGHVVERLYRAGRDGPGAAARSARRRRRCRPLGLVHARRAR